MIIFGVFPECVKLRFALYSTISLIILMLHLIRNSIHFKLQYSWQSKQICFGRLIHLLPIIMAPFPHMVSSRFRTSLIAHRHYVDIVIAAYHMSIMLLHPCYDLHRERAIIRQISAAIYCIPGFHLFNRSQSINIRMYI